ncbi:MAG: PAS domain-containing protein [Hyphomicrobium sp.]|nr:PAS domain-containing protein [Hyphomicrobium sp.]
MLLDAPTASQLVDEAVWAVSSGPDSFHEVLDRLPAPIYVTDGDGTVTYFNQACVELAGRTPEPGRDKWCVTWKIYSADGEFVPHDQGPMAVAIREQRPIRNVEAIAERPDGTTVNFMPFPTPWFDSDGNMAGAVNLLLDISAQRGPDYLLEQAEKCRRLANSITDAAATDTLNLMAAKYDAQALKLSRLAA